MFLVEPFQFGHMVVCSIHFQTVLWKTEIEILQLFVFAYVESFQKCYMLLLNFKYNRSPLHNFYSIPAKRYSITVLLSIPV